ncbi:type IV pili methyl-accepting chemotaxis transducer N-terminal domain-containing protein [Piscinibacter sp. XHJ-5]|uniref:type IV pili methyl-accepting chemotaxis transducer N-terminal domain-containing protein n=1 Tax=Piscinibacter sp. XHJ-5 TaxID=3037797 RepID=UPI002452DEE1|nr:type IV pili methyl-accepting chemotaxis transducer N-terminal domain-containing protein [Piscinibacter sp. XHJ-5]
MTSCLVLCGSAPVAPTLEENLEGVGIHVIGAVQRSNLVQEALRQGPDVVVVQDVAPDAALFAVLALLRTTAPRPVLLFTTDSDVDKMKLALDSGVDAYVVNGYAPQRLRSLVHLATARFLHEQALREQLADVSHRFEERKLVDRAKGILMRARQVSEDEAFRVLRAASMHSNRRVGQVSQQVIAAAGLAEAINRAGQLRMLSQRLVKLRALQALGVGTEWAAELLRDSSSRIDANLAALGKSVSKATYGDLLDAVSAPWVTLKAALAMSADRQRTADADAQAEVMLLQADRLVNAFESNAATASLHVINVSGRQRMLSQRLAKQALLAALSGGDAAAAAGETKAAFEQALDYLNAAPLSTREIRESLDAAARSWTALNQALKRVRSADGQMVLTEASESLLAVFEQLTERYEHSMQILMG